MPRRDGASSARRNFATSRCLSQLAWFDEEFQEHDPEVRALVDKGRNFTLEDQALMGRKQREICAHVIPEYRKLAASGQIEISTTPFYHPILPLLCDSDIASVSHPHVPLPPRFCYPEDARLQLRDGARVHQEDLRRGAGRAVAFRRLGLRSRAAKSPPPSASNGRPPTTAFSTGRCAAPRRRRSLTAPTSGRSGTGRCA